MDFQTFFILAVDELCCTTMYIGYNKKPAVRQEYKRGQYINNSYREVKKL